MTTHSAEICKLYLVWEKKHIFYIQGKRYSKSIKPTRLGEGEARLVAIVADNASSLSSKVLVMHAKDKKN